MAQDFQWVIPLRSSHDSLPDSVVRKPRSLEVFESLGVAEEIIKRAIDIPMFRMYKMPGGVDILKEFAPAPHLNPTPDRPYVSRHSPDLLIYYLAMCLHCFPFTAEFRFVRTRWPG